MKGRVLWAFSTFFGVFGCQQQGVLGAEAEDAAGGKDEDCASVGGGKSEQATSQQ